MVQWRLRSKCRNMRRFSIKIFTVQDSIHYSIQWTMNLNTTILRKQSGCWMSVTFANWKLTESQGMCNQFQVYLVLRFCCSMFGQHSSLCGDAFGIQICLECWWQIKWVLARHLPQWQQLWYTKCWLKRLLQGCLCQCCGGIPMNSGWIWHQTTIPGSLVMTGSGIWCGDWNQFPAAIGISRQLNLSGI